MERARERGAKWAIRIVSILLCSASYGPLSILTCSMIVYKCDSRIKITVLPAGRLLWSESAPTSSESESINCWLLGDRLLFKLCLDPSTPDGDRGSPAAPSDSIERLRNGWKWCVCSSPLADVCGAAGCGVENDIRLFGSWKPLVPDGSQPSRLLLLARSEREGEVSCGVVDPAAWDMPIPPPGTVYRRPSSRASFSSLNEQFLT